jgi:hypothetical protein
MLHYSRIVDIMERKGPDRFPVPFSLRYVKMDNGKIMDVAQAVITSSYRGNRYVNIKFLPSNEIRKIRRILIIEFNGQKIYI